MRRGVYSISVLLGIALLATTIITCNKKATTSSGIPPADTVVVVASDYLFLDTARPFQLISTTDLVSGCEPKLPVEATLGEPFTDVNHNGRYDPGIDLFIISNDPALNQDLNHNGRYDGPGIGVNCGTSGVPFDDIDGDGKVRCSGTDYFCADPADTIARRVPFVDYNGNGIWDSMPGMGVNRGRWRWYPDHSGGWIADINPDSAYRFVSDSGWTYYMKGLGVTYGSSVTFYRDTSGFGASVVHFILSFPAAESLQVPSVSRYPTSYNFQPAEMKRELTKYPSLKIGDSTYSDLVQVSFRVDRPDAQGLGWDFYCGKNRGLLKATIKNHADNPPAVLEAMDKPLPLPLTRPAR